MAKKIKLLTREQYETARKQCTHVVKIPVEELYLKPVYEMTDKLLARIAVVEQMVRDLSAHKLTCDPEVKRPRWRKKNRIFKYTQALFDLVPGMVGRAEFQDWTGLADKDLDAAVAKHEIEVYQPDSHEKRRYYKREIARLTGFKL